jgi:putative tryptophan/tyrosine transport system substrate-binding protein
MTPSLLCLVLLLVCWPFAGTAAEARVLVVRDDTLVARQVADQLGRELGRLGLPAGEVVLGERTQGELRRDESRLTIALGYAAWQAARQLGRPTIAALISRAAIEEFPWLGSERCVAVVLDQPLERWAGLIRLGFPDRQRVGVLAGSSLQKVLRPLERKFQEQRLILEVERMAADAAVVPALERLLPRVGVLLALPDAQVHNSSTVQPLLLTTYRAAVPVVGYSEAYFHAGAALALYSTPLQIAMQVAEETQHLLDGRPVVGVQAPRYFTVSVNRAVARSLGLVIPAEGELQERLHSIE